MVVKLDKSKAKAGTVKTITRELEEIDAEFKCELANNNIRKAIEASRRWVKLARAGGLLR